ncbi:MAG: Gfo/Idh/MocA family oxidoreductase [Bacteroidales bacterium]
MKSNRRFFLKTGLAGAGALATGSMLGGNRVNAKDLSSSSKGTSNFGSSVFNMCGYRAPKLDTVRIGFVGLGMRGPGAVTRMSHIEGVEIAALCDKYSERVDKIVANLDKRGIKKPKVYAGNEDSWKKMCEDPDLDLIYITTPWELHTDICVYGMEHGKHVATEVPAAETIEDCWRLVETSERTRKHCMMLENCCYDDFEILTLNMAQQGAFGELIHGEGAYIHDLLSLNFAKFEKSGNYAYADMWRLKENQHRNGNLYTTHGLGPVAQSMGLNRGDQADFLVSVSTNDFMMAEEAKKRASEDSFYNSFVSDGYRGNMNTSTIRTVNGKTIMIQHDVTSPRPYSRIHLLSGTTGFARKYPTPGKIAFGHKFVSEEEMKELQAKYTPEIIKKVGDMAKQIGGHGGMDTVMDWHLIDNLRNGLPLAQDVYDAALWSSIGPLSEHSVSHRSQTMEIPDFTRGNWRTNAPVDVNLKEGGNTRILKVNNADKKSQLKVD